MDVLGWTSALTVNTFDFASSIDCHLGVCGVKRCATTLRKRAERNEANSTRLHVLLSIPFPCVSSVSSDWFYQLVLPSWPTSMKMTISRFPVPSICSLFSGSAATWSSLRDHICFCTLTYVAQPRKHHRKSKFIMAELPGSQTELNMEVGVQNKSGAVDPACHSSLLWNSFRCSTLEYQTDSNM